MKNFIIINTQSNPFRWLELHAEYKADWYIRYLFKSPDYNHLAVMWCEL